MILSFFYNYAMQKIPQDLPVVRLRALEPEDLSVLYETENDTAIWDAGGTNVPYSRHVLLDYITNARADIYADCQVRLMAENGHGETVGMVDLVNFDPRHRRAELGVVTRQAFRRQGYGEAMVRQIVDYARHVIYLHQVYAIVSHDNIQCLSVLKNVGFKAVACLDDWLFDGTSYKAAVQLQLIL